MIPQRKKTPEEIAKLREELGLSGPVPPVSPPPSQPAPPAAAQPPIHQAPPPAQWTPPPVAPPPATAPPPAPVPEIPVTPTPSEPKPVRSLRRSERIPPAQPAVRNSASSSLPVRRHSTDEINRIRRAEAIGNQQAPQSFLIPLTAHPFLVAIGYTAVFGAIILSFIDAIWVRVPFYIPALLCVVSLATAVFIFLKKKRSLHHAGFLAAITFFVLIFGALYYFPQLRNAP